MEINSITVKAGRRTIDSAKVRELANSMNEIGLINPITVTQDRVLITGAHRLEAARLLGWTDISATVSELDGLRAELAEIDENLMRNELHSLQRGNYINRREALLSDLGLRAGRGRPEKWTESGHLLTTPEIAKSIGVSKTTLNEEKRISAAIPDDVQEVIIMADLPKEDTKKIARHSEDEQRQIAEKIASGYTSYADAIREVRREEVVEKLNDISARETKRLEGKYDVIVIDPPWPIQKIEYDVRPNQVVLDYPTMTEDELAAMKMPAADDCHLWLWTTHKYLPMAFRLLDTWGFKYTCTFVWHKDNGIQPIGLPKYNCEFALYARRGNPKFIDAKAFFLCFHGESGAHSEKPKEFYDLVRRVTAGARIDIFNRREIDGFDRWGNEA
jgi:N6-adenosine-specific RNA methylase IME4